jgi:acyl-coenzyme A synthetase/AMP-(fatty) acid ligase
MTWLGLVQLGCRVLFLSTGSGKDGILSLCQTCNVSLILYDDTHASLVNDAFLGASFDPLALSWTFPWAVKNLNSILRTLPCSSTTGILSTSPETEAVIFHTSGTTGRPKPIIQRHQDVVGVCHNFSRKSSGASLSTSPLTMAGGVADVIRSWTSGNLIWIFPANKMPITGSNVIKSIEVANLAATRETNLPAVRYLSCVPYVLQMIIKEPQGMDALRSCSIVGIGGASLDSNIGDMLVSNGVNLISRYGSSENGCKSYRYFPSAILTYSFDVFKSGL